MIKVEINSKNFGQQNIFNDFYFRFKKDRLYILKGHSGCGKTTLLKIIGGLDKNFNGQISNLNYTNQNELVSEVVFLPQQNFLIEDLNAYFNFNLHLNSENFFCIREFKRLSKKLGVYSKLKKKIKKLSYGEKKRIALCIKLSSFKQIMLLDEPCEGLDLINKRKVLKILKEKSKNNLIIASMHEKPCLDLDVHILDLEKEKKTKSDHNLKKEDNYNIKEIRRIKNKNIFKCYYKLFKWQIIFVSIVLFSFLFSTIANSYLLANVDDSLNENKQEILDYNFFKKNEKTNENIESILDKISNDLGSYGKEVVSHKFYNSKVLLNNQKISNGFLFSKIYKHKENLQQNELVIKGSKKEICDIFKINYCIYPNIESKLKDNELLYKGENITKEFNIKNIVIDENFFIYSSNINLFSSFDKKSNNNFIFKLDKTKIDEFDKSIKKHENISFSLKQETKFNLFFKVKQINNAYFNSTDLEKIKTNYFYCNDRIYMCDPFFLTSRLSFMESFKYREKKFEAFKIQFSPEKKANLGIKEIIISDKLAKSIGFDKNYPFLKVDIFGDSYILKVDSVFKSEKKEIRQNSIWLYLFFRDVVSMPYFSLRSSELLIGSEYENNDYIKESLFDEVGESFDQTYKRIETFLNNINVFLNITNLVLFLFLITLQADKANKFIKDNLHYGFSKSDIFYLILKQNLFIFFFSFFLSFIFLTFLLSININSFTYIGGIELLFIFLGFLGMVIVQIFYKKSSLN